MKPRYLILGGVLLVAAMLAVWRVGYHGIDPRLILWPPAAELSSPAALDEAAEIDVSDLPLKESLELLADRYQVQIELDTFAVSSTGLTGAEPVSLRLRNVSLRALLSHLARGVELVVRTRGDVIYLTTEDAWATNPANLTARVYPLDRLLAGPLPFREADLEELITSICDVQRDRCHAMPGAIIVSAPAEQQALVAELLEVLAKASEEAMNSDSVWLDWSPRKEAIYATLARPTTLEFVEAELPDIAAYIEQEFGIPVVFDPRIWKPGDDLRTFDKLTFTAREVSLQEGLSQLLEREKLSFEVVDEAILITFGGSDFSVQFVGVYPVADLLSISSGIQVDEIRDIISAASGSTGKMRIFAGCLVANDHPDAHESIVQVLTELRRTLHPDSATDLPKEGIGKRIDDGKRIFRCYRVLRPIASAHKAKIESHFGQADDFVEAIKATVAPDTWRDSCATMVKDLLLVSQTRKVHTQLADLLAKLTRLEHGPPTTEPWLIGERSQEEQRIADILSRPADIEFVGAKLEDVIESLNESHSIPMRLDTSRLELEYRPPVITCKFADVPVALALELMLDEHDLTFVIREREVVVTTRMEAKPSMGTRLYDVRDLAGKLSIGNSMDEAIDLGWVAALWNHQGDGAARQIDGVLIITQTPDVQEQVDRFLATLRALPKQPEDLTPLELTETPRVKRGLAEQALARRRGFSYVKRPLSEIIQELEQETGLKIVFDRLPGITRADSSELRQVISYAADNVSWREALDGIVAAPLNLPSHEADPLLTGESQYYWQLRGEVLLLTTVANRPHLFIRVYPVADLFGGVPGDDSSRFALQNALDKTVSPLINWNGEAFHWVYFGDYLVVAASRRSFHRNVETVLTELRAKRAS